MYINLIKLGRIKSIYFTYLFFTKIYFGITARVIRKNFFGHYAGGGRKVFWPFFGPNLQKM
jgi:hypothetical protein